jgi:hypothetical protein
MSPRIINAMEEHAETAEKLSSKAIECCQYSIGEAYYFS